jgi:hypothetical protein
MVTVSLQDQSCPTSAVPFACRPIRPGGKIAQLLEGIGAEYFAISFAELWGLPIGEESVETIAGEVQL